MCLDVCAYMYTYIHEFLNLYEKEKFHSMIRKNLLRRSSIRESLRPFDKTNMPKKKQIANLSHKAINKNNRRGL